MDVDAEEAWPEFGAQHLLFERAVSVDGEEGTARALPLLGVASVRDSEPTDGLT